jgi:hypothetical protein
MRKLVSAWIPGTVVAAIQTSDPANIASADAVPRTKRLATDQRKPKPSVRRALASVREAQSGILPRKRTSPMPKAMRKRPAPPLRAILPPS